MTIKKKMILVVDDSPVMQRMTEKVLVNDHFSVKAAYTAEECLEAAVARPPDLILMDVILTDGNGKDVVRKLKEHPVTAKVPIIFTTNTLDLEDDDGRQLFEINGEHYRAFAKPLHYRKLLSAIHKEINRSLHGGDLPPVKKST